MFERHLQTDIRYLVSGSFWLLLGKGVVFVISLLTTLAFANWLSKESFGTYQYVLALTGFAIILSLPGMHTALVRSIARKKEGTLKLIVKTRLKWSILGSIIMLGSGAWYFYQAQTLLALALTSGAIFLPLYATFPVFDAYWDGKKRFDIKSKYEIVATVFIALFIVPTIYFTNNVLIILLVLFSSSVLINGFLLHKTLKKTENIDKDKKSIPFGKHITAINGIAIAASHIDKIILWKFLGPIQLAIYTLALLPLQKILTLNPIGTLALPKLSENGVNRHLLKKMLIGVAITIPIAIVLTVLAPFIYNLFFPQYMESVIYFQVLTILMVFTPFLLLRIALIAETKQKELYTTNVISSVTKIALYLMLVPIWGIWGAIFGVVIGEIIWNGLHLYFFLKITSAKNLRNIESKPQN